MQTFPPYTYIPGKTPHPISSRDGHLYQTGPPTFASTKECFDEATSLFDHGFYWEAHEHWETLWMKHGRTGAQADYLKALIKLAACGVKCLEGNRLGAERHLHRSIELLRQCEQHLEEIDSFGLPLPLILAWATVLELELPVQRSDQVPGPVKPLLGRIPTR